MKDCTYRDEEWLAAVRALRVCVLCRAWGTQAAHRNEGKGGAKKVDDCLAASICPDCHAEIDQGHHLTRGMRRAVMDRAIVLTLRELVARGWVVLASGQPWKGE